MLHRLLSLFTLLLAGSLVAQVTFTSSGTFIVPEGVTSITVELIGAGGNGASNGGGGGGGGAYARGTFSVTPGTSYSMVIGEGGSELASILGGLGMLAGAGENASTAPNPQIGGGGAGGTPLGAQVGFPGGNGGGGYWTYFGGGGGGAAGPSMAGSAGGNTIAWTGMCLTPGGASGASGGGPAGNGGKGAGFTDANCSVTDPAGNGALHGGGGGGGNGVGSPVGIGGGGWARITWDTPTGIQDALNTKPQLLPGPFVDRIGLLQPTGKEHYTLLDLAGRAIWSGHRMEQQDLSHLPEGGYLLQVTLGDAVHVYRTVKVQR
jgi:hypothetical protein